MRSAPEPSPGPFFSWRIRWLLAAAMSLLVIASITALTLVEASREQVRYRQELLDRGQLIAEVLGQILADVLYFDDVEGTRHLAEIARAMPEVRRYRVFDSDGRVLVDSNAAKYGSGTVEAETLGAVLTQETVAIGSDDTLEVTVPILAGEEVLGGVAIRIATDAVAPHVRLILRERLRYGGVVVFAGILLSFLFGHWLTAPIRTLVLAARRVASGDLSFSSERPRRDEIGDLAAAFQDMVLKLREQAKKDAEENTMRLERANALLHRHAMEDALTGLPNRRLLLDRFAMASAKAKRAKEKLALLFIDLDQFKIINDSLGHASGDQVLLELARRLKAALREGDTVARLGGDEFVVLVTGLDSRDHIAVIAQKILDMIQKPVNVGGRKFRLTASVGVSVYPDHGTTPEELQRKSDLAMYQAKSSGRNSFLFFESQMENLAASRLELERDLQRALAEDEFTCHLQPILDLSTGEVAAVEALLRWRHPERGLLGAGEFVHLLELTGRMEPLDNLVLTRASRWMKDLSARHSVQLAVNLSAHHFTRETLVSEIDQILSETGFDPQFLEIEITESAAIPHDLTTERTFRALSDLGVSISIDDFGTGYASLSYLRHLPVSKVKIDREFVQGLPGSESDAAIIESVVVLAHNLGIRVTAEGVETEEQTVFLSRLGCDELQGNWFQPPMPPADLVDFLARAAPQRLYSRGFA